MFQILVAEDDANQRRLMSAVLRGAGYEVHTAADGAEALRMLDEVHVDLLVLDVMMPKLDGFELTRQLRDGGSALPILMVTARQLPQDKHTGFLVGTDDYMIKPVDEEELLLRIRALLRRARIVSEHRIVLGGVTLDYDGLTVERSGESQTLPQKEFYLLYKLLAYPDKVFTRLQLMDEIWGMDSETGENTVNVHINRLRNRFRDWPEFEIVAVRGIGYKAVRHV
jgi:DNA-binding response OmpR family regulator